MTTIRERDADAFERLKAGDDAEPLITFTAALMVTVRQDAAGKWLAQINLSTIGEYATKDAAEARAETDRQIMRQRLREFHARSLTP